ncbi:MAG: hypothetical protein ACPGXI_06635 [Mycobacterium sp.]
MANHAGTDQGVPDDHVNDGDAKAAAQILDDNAASGNASAEVTSARENAPLSLLPILPISVGVSICALNILVAFRVWQNTYNSNLTSLNRVNLPTTVFLALLSISFFIGLLLIAYAVILPRLERHRYEDKTEHGAGQTPAYVKWIIAPLVIALPAPVITVWAAQLIEPIAPKPCIELYQEAQNIKNDNPNFKMVWSDRDQRRCAINQSVLAN